MFRKIGTCLTAFGVSHAARVKNTGQSVENDANLADAAPSSVASGVKETEIRHCALWNFQAFEGMVAQCPDGSSASDSMALAVKYHGNMDSVLLMSRQDSLSLAAMNTSDTFVDMSLCAEGQPFNVCAESLPSMLWMRQYWRFQDSSHIVDLSPEDKMKSRILNTALHNYGISHSRLHSKCAREIHNPAFEIMRECVLNSVPTFVQSHRRNDALRRIQNPFGEQVDLSDDETFQQTLETWLRGMWEKDDAIRALHHAAGRRFRFGCRSAKRQMEKERAAHQKSIAATFFPIKHSGVTQECHEASPSALAASGTLARIIGEVGACAGNGANCTEQEHPCPEGFKPDWQRSKREGGNLVAGAVVGSIAGIAVGTAVPFAIAGAAGLAFAPEMALTWAYGSLLLGGKAEMAAVGGAAGSNELSKSCMCFPVECTYDEDSGQCEMRPSETSTASRNPFSNVPFNGLKCVEHTNHHWFHRGKQCDLAQCNQVDTAEVGPTMGGQQLFGRVGRSADWEEGGIYNCANTDGTDDTLLSRLDQIPSPAGETVDNTVEGRIEILQQYS